MFFSSTKLKHSIAQTKCPWHILVQDFLKKAVKVHVNSFLQIKEKNVDPLENMNFD